MGNDYSPRFRIDGDESQFTAVSDLSPDPDKFNCVAQTGENHPLTRYPA